MSMGAASKPATVSNGGLLGADGCDFVDANILVRPKLLFIFSDSAISIADSSLGKSSRFCQHVEEKLKLPPLHQCD